MPSSDFEGMGMTMGHIDELDSMKVAAYLTGRLDYPDKSKCTYNLLDDPNGFMAYWNGWNDSMFGDGIFRVFEAEKTLSVRGLEWE